MLKNHWQILEKTLSAIALVIVTLIFLKAIIYMDTTYDSSWYHLPFAARIWGIVPEESFLPQDLLEYRFDGFPLLANFLQGFFWKITGRMQTTNLVGYFSLLIYFFFLKSYFKVPLYLSVIAIFTIPLVLIHASISYVDLPGNIGLSVLMLMVYSLFRQSRLPNKRELIATFLGAATAANIKPQLQPLVFLLYLIVGMRLIWLYFKYTDSTKRRLSLTISLAIIASGLIFATPIKNVALYGNPFYPIKIEVAGIVLNHKLTPETYSEGNRPQKWLRSIFEINTPQWTADQWNFGKSENLDRAGGFFGAYVVFNLLLLLGLTIREQLQNRLSSSENKSRNATTALITVLLVSLIPANFPQSHELRYFMFWMITLVSLNLCIVTSLQKQAPRWIQPQYLGVICLIFLTIVYTKISNFHYKSGFVKLDAFLNNNTFVKKELLEQMTPNERTCMISLHGIPNPKAVPVAQAKNAFYYSSYFHPEIKYDYSIKATAELENCGDLKIIPVNYKTPKVLELLDQ